MTDGRNQGCRRRLPGAQRHGHPTEISEKEIGWRDGPWATSAGRRCRSDRRIFQAGDAQEIAAGDTVPRRQVRGEAARRVAVARRPGRLAFYPRDVILDGLAVRPTRGGDPVGPRSGERVHPRVVACEDYKE